MKLRAGIGNGVLDRSRDVLPVANAAFFEIELHQRQLVGDAPNPGGQLLQTICSCSGMHVEKPRETTIVRYRDCDNSAHRGGLQIACASVP